MENETAAVDWFAFYSLLSNERGFKAKFDIIDTVLFTPFDKDSAHSTLFYNKPGHTIASRADFEPLTTQNATPSPPKGDSTVRDKMIPFTNLDEIVARCVQARAHLDKSTLTRPLQKILDRPRLLRNLPPPRPAAPAHRSP